MEERKDQFQTFSDSRLMEIVRYARQYGYDDSVRNLAIEVLSERGMTLRDLQMTGNLTNHKFDRAKDLFKSYTRSAMIAFFSYTVALILKGIVIFHLFGMDEPGILYSLTHWLFFAFFLIMLIKSFLDQLEFYRAINKPMGSADQLLFFILGMPLYIVMYFLQRGRMKEEMRMIK